MIYLLAEPSGRWWGETCRHYLLNEWMISMSEYIKVQ